MKRRGPLVIVLTGCIVAVLLGSSTNPSYPPMYGPNLIVNQTEYVLASSVEQFAANNLSDMDGAGYLGSHSNFANQQSGPDAIYDTLAEENTAPITTDVEDDYDSYVSDADSSPDIGSEANPTNAQGTLLDSQYMVIQETDIGDPYQSIWLDANSYDATLDSGIEKYGTSPYLDSPDYPTNYVRSKKAGDQGGWWYFPSTTLSGDLSVNVSLYCWNNGGANDDGWDIYYDTSGGTGTLLGRVAQHTSQQYDNLSIVGTLTQQQVNALRIRIVFYKSGGADYAYIDHIRVGVSSPKVINNDLDFEYNWATADNDETNEEVCINVGSIMGSEALNVSYWDGLDWVYLGVITSSGWTNLTALGLDSVSYTIRLQGADNTSDAEQGLWEIDLITLHTWTDQTYNYELDLEVQWTAAEFDNNNEFLCIYAGTTDSEDIAVEVWDGLAWVSLFTDLQADTWNNMSVETWLTSATFTIRFRGGQEVGDSVVSQWSIDATLLHTWNNIPSNDQQPSVANIDDVSYMYAKARDYLIAANVSDQDGYGDIQSMRLSLYSDDRLTLYWTIEYNEDTDSFAEFSDPANYITLDTISSSALRVGNDIDITFQVSIEWIHPDITGTDVECVVIDSKSENATDWYEVDWDIETQLDIVGIAIDDNLGTIDRGDFDSQFFTTGTVTYHESAITPPSSEVDVWVSGSEYGTSVGPWPDTSLVSGLFNVTCYADDEVGQDTYTVKVVQEGAGFGGTDLLFSSIADTFVADRIEFYQSGVDDSRIDVDSSGVTWWSARYQYDSLSITSGLSVALNGTKTLSWNGSYWTFQETVSTVQAIGYSVASAYDTTHGLVGWVQTASNTTVIWDRIRILATTAQDGRIDYGTAADIRVTAELEFDGHLLGVGDTLYMNSTAMTWVGPYFRLQPQFSQVGLWRFYVNATGAMENTYDITVVNLDGKQIDQIWDRILIITTTASDGRIDYGASTTVNVTAQLEYDGTQLGSGDTLRMNDTAMTWDSDHFYLETGSYSMVGLLRYYVNASGALETAFGITVVQSNPIPSDVIWDRILITSTASQDSRIDISAIADLRVTAELEYDGHPVGLGDILYMNNTAMTWVGSYFRLQPQFSDVGMWRFYVNSTGCLEATFQISQVNPAGMYTDQIWDRIVIVTTTTQDGRIDFGSSADLRVTAELQFDSHPLDAADTLYMNNTMMTWVGTYFRLQPQFFMVGSWDFYVNSSNANEATYGISALFLNGNSVSQIWDRIEFYQSGTVDSRVDVDDGGLVYWNVRYEYDGIEITGVTFTASMNGSKALNWNSSAFRWDYSETKNSVQLVGYEIASASETAYGLSIWVQTASNVSIIWDEIEFYSSGVEDDRIDIEAVGTTWWRARYAYDQFEITGGLSASLNGSKALSWNGITSRWDYSESFSTVQSMGYGVVSASESLYGLTRFTQIATNTTIIWDKITVQTTNVDINHLNAGSTAQIQVTLWLEFDHTYLGSGDSVFVNDSAMTWDGGNSHFVLDVAFTTVGKWAFFVNSTLESSYGISAVDLNSLSVEVIWDRILILSITADDSRVNVGDTVELQVTAKLEYTGNGDHFLGSADTLYMDGVSMVWSAPQSAFVHSASHSSVGLWKYFVNSTNAYETDFGISVVNLDSNILDVFWDQLVIDIQADAELVLNGKQVNFTLTVTFESDGTECTTYEIVCARNNTDWLAFTYLNATLFNDTNSDLVYLYNASSVISETLYNITLFITNIELVNWTSYIPIVPVNEAPPNLLNPDDTDNMYARLRYYRITSNASDSNGYQDIRLVSLLLFSDDRGTNYWTVTFIRSNSSFSITNGSMYISLGPCTYEQSGIWLNITWYIKISWSHPDIVDVDTKQFVSNTFSTASDWYESDWDIETRLDYSTLPSLDDDRGNVDTADLAATGALTYYASPLYPLANETDFWVLHDISGSWSGEVDGLGGLTATGIGSSSLVRVNTYTFKVVPEGDGASGADLYYAESVKDTFISDQIEFYISGVDDGRIDAGSTGTTYWGARYDYDDAIISSGMTSFLTGSKALVWNGSHWIYSESRPVVELQQYAILSASETLYGLTAWTQTASDTAIIWDRILIITTIATDGRIDYGASTTVNVTAQLQYDGTQLSSGDTLRMSDTVMTWDSDHFYLETGSQSIVGLLRYYVNASGALETGFGITVVNQNGNFQDVIWDRISVQTTVADDERVNVNDIVQIRVTLMLEYDSTFLGSGDVVVLAGQAMSWDSGNSWFELDVSKSDVGSWTYYVNSSTMSAYGITELNLNGRESSVIWDRIRIFTTTAADNRINYGTSTIINVTAELEYDGYLLGSGDALYANDTLMAWNVNHFELTTGAYSIIGILNYFVNSTGAVESTYGITLVNLNSQAASVIWDRIKVITTSTQDNRIDYGSAADIRVTAVLEYDNHPLGSGDILYMDDAEMTWVSSYFQYQPIRNEVGSWNYFVNTSNALEATYGISLVNIDSKSVDQIWDRILVLTTSMQDGRIDYDTQADIRVTAQLEFDGHSLSVDDVLYMNDTQMTWVGSYFQYKPQFAQVGEWIFFVNASNALEDTYGISYVNLAGRSVAQIWDRIQITTTVADDNRVNLGTTVTISVTAQLEFDGHILTASDTLYLDDTLMSWNTDHFEYQTSKVAVGLWRYYVNSTLASEVTHGISSLNPAVLSTDVVWDRILILTTSTTDDRIDYASSAVIVVTAVLEFDNHPLGVDDTIYMDNKVMIWSIDHFEYQPSRSEVGSWRYYVNSSNAFENTYSITLLNLNSKYQDVVWDRIEFYQSGVVDGRIDTNSVGETWWKARYQYDGVEIDITKGFSTALNGSKILAWDAGATRWRYQETSASVQRIGYHVVIASELVYGLTQWVATASNTTIIWDQIVVISYSNADSRIDINTGCSCNVSLIYDFDDSYVIDGFVWINGIGATYTGSNGVWDFTDTRSVAQLVTYDTVSTTANQYGITAVNQNSQIQGIVWDSLTITITVGDSRIDIYTIASVVPTAIYDYDGSVYDGTLLLNDTTFQQASAGRRGYTVDSASGDSFGISAIRQNMIVFCVWDSLTISISAIDHRIDVGSVASVSASAVYDYDGTPYDGTLALNDTVFQQGVVGARAYTVDSASGDTHGISVISNNDVYVMIWDRLRVLSYSVSDARCDLGSIQEITAIVIREYDGVLFRGAMGTVFLNGTPMAWDSGDLVWTQLQTYSTVVRYAFGVSSITDTQFGISAIQAAAEPSIIWDALSITITVADDRINIGDTASIIPAATYLYDGSSYDGKLNLNDTNFFYNSMQQHWYSVESADGDDTYGITVIEINDEVYCIWDSLTISITNPSDQRIDVNTNASGIVVSAVYDFDNTPYDGSLELNNTEFIYSSAQRQGYKVAFALGDDSFGIAAIWQNAETYCIWDSLTISITDPPDQRVNIGDTATGIVVSATYDYDGANYDGTLELNDTQFTYATVGKHGYEVLTPIGDDGFGITAISTPDSTFCIWDRLRIEITVDGASLFNGQQANFTMMVTYDYDSTACTTYEVVILRNMTAWHTFTDSNKSLFRDTASNTIFYYNASSVSSETSFGIITFITTTQKVTWSEAPNEVPVNTTDGLTMLENADDSDNLYARYRFYVITSNVSDGNGYYALQYVEISLYDNLRIQAEWTLRYTIASDSFSIQQGASNVILASWSSASGGGNQLVVTWIIKLDWNHTDLIDIDIRQYVTDGIDSDEDYYEVNWDVETRLDISGLTISDGSGTVNRGPLDGSFSVSGTLLYLGSGDNHPLSNETDVWVLSSEYGSSAGPWSDTTLVLGQFALTGFADDLVGQDTITVIAVEEGLGSGAQDLFSTSIESTYTADRVLVQSYSPDDSRVNVDDNVNLDIALIYEFDSTPVTDGTVTVNSIPMSHVGGGVWRITVSKSSVQEVIYDDIAYTGGTHGLSQVDQNAQSQSIIWDSLTISITGPIDNRINILENASGIVVTATYDFDNSDYDGTLNLNDTSFVSPGALKKGYTVLNAAGDDTHGITLISQNDVVYCIWDSLTITITDPFDQRVNIGTNASGIIVTAVYDYDNSSFDGILSLNVTQFAYASSQRQGYGIQSISGGSYGITAISIDDATFCIWDALTISITDPPDQRINVNQNASGIIVSVRYAYDNSIYDGTLLLNDTEFASAVAIKKGYTVLSAVGDDSYGITNILSNDDTWCIWDSLTVSISDPIDQRININANASGIIVTATYDYDGSVFDGTLLLNNTQFSYDVAQKQAYTLLTVSGGIHGINAISNNDVTYCIWDSLKVTITINDRRIDIGSAASIQASAVYDYDGQLYDGILALNDTVNIHGTVGRWAYTVESAVGDTYGISAIRLNAEDYVIWDRLRIIWYSIDPDDNRTNVGAIHQVYTIVTYEYDNTVFQGTSGTVFMNNSAMTWNGALWYRSYVYTTPVRYVFQVSNITDMQYGLTVIFEGQPPRSIIWDKLNVVLESDTSVAFYNKQVNFTVTATRQYDGSRVDLLIVQTLRNGNYSFFNNFTDTWTRDYDVHQQYLVISAQDGTYGITEFDTVMIEVFWTDAPLVVVDDAGTSEGDNRVNIGTAVYVYFHCMWANNGSSVESGLLYINSIAYSINETGWVLISDSSLVVLRRNWTVTDVSVPGMAGYEVDSSNPYMIWDALEVSLQVANSRVNPGDEAPLEFSAIYLYDGANYDGVPEYNDTIIHYTVVGARAFTVSSVSGDRYGITTIASNQEATVIWDGLIVTLSIPYNRVNVGTDISIQVSAVYAFDGLIFNGDIRLNDTVTEQSFIGRRGYRAVNGENGTPDIWFISYTNGISVIWDELEVHWSDTERRRCDLGSSVQVRFRVRYSSDRAPYTDANGKLWINDKEATYDSLDEYWFISVIKDVVGEYDYLVTNFMDYTSEVTNLVDAEVYQSTATFDSVYVLLAGVRGTNMTSGSVVNLPAPGTLLVPVGSNVTIYFKLRYQSDDTIIVDPNTIVSINGHRARFMEGEDVWEATFTEAASNLIEYIIDSFEDQYGLTEVDHRNRVPKVEWAIPAPEPLSPTFLIFGLAVFASASVALFAVRARRRVTTLEHALTPEELLSLEDVGISSSMRAQIVNHLEWLRDLSEEIPYMGNSVLVILSEELAQAKEMYIKAFELEIPTEPAGLRLRDMLLNRIDTILESIEKEMASRSSRT